MSHTRTISFSRGAPSLDLVDVDGLREAAARALSRDNASRALLYGTATGYEPLRTWIADQHDVEPECVILTNGSMQAGALLFEELVHFGDHVVVEKPTYDRTLLALRERGAVVHPVATDAHGLDVDELEGLLEMGMRPVLVHTIPNFQNPGGSTLSLERRGRLAALADAHEFVLLEDDPYRLLRFAGQDHPTMLTMSDRVVHASSFSKTICPGVRVGCLVGATALIDRIAALATRTYISPNLAAQAIVHEFCASGAIDRSIAHFKLALRERVETLTGALERELPQAGFTRPSGGYFLWLEMPDDFDAGRLAREAGERGVVVVPGSDFLLEGGENALRLAYSAVTPEEIDAGITTLAATARSYL